jgi:uncharacterized metal-binding protein YceD (DUF177 family)
MYNVSLVDIPDEGREFHFRVPKNMPLFKSQLGRFSTDLDVRGEVVQRDEVFFIINLVGQTEVEAPCRRCLKNCNSTIRFERKLYINKGVAEEEDPDEDFLTIGPDNVDRTSMKEHVTANHGRLTRAGMPSAGYSTKMMINRQERY